MSSIQQQAPPSAEGTRRPGPDTPAEAAALPRERRARLIVRRLDPLSVLKFSLLFYFCLLLVGILVFAVVWLTLNSMGLFGQLTEFAAEFNVTLKFDAGTVFKWLALAGLGGVLLWTVVTVLMTLLFNLVNDITGGLQVVLAEPERRPASGSAAARVRLPRRERQGAAG